MPKPRRPADPPTPAKKGRRYPGAVGWLAVLIACFYWWTASSSGNPFTFGPWASGYYNSLTRGLLQGHLYLPEKPSPQLLAQPDPYDPAQSEPYRMHDLSLYQGRYYLYFGVTPALTAFLPAALLGVDLTENFVASTFCVLGFAFSLLLFNLLTHHLELAPPVWLRWVACLSLGLGQFVPYMLRRPSFYEVAIGGGYCFLMGGLFYLIRGLLAERRRLLSMTLAGLMLGLTPGCRPNLSLGVAAAFFVAAWLFHRRQGGWPALRTPPFLAFCLAITACALGLAWYNFARFGSPLEFGIRYQLTIMRMVDTGVHLNRLLPHILLTIYYCLLRPPELLDAFPFFHLRPESASGWWVPAGRFYEPVAGLLAVAPASLLGLLAPLVYRWRPSLLSGREKDILPLLWVPAAVNFAVLTPFGWASMRYAVDFSPLIQVIALLAAAWLLQKVLCPGRWATLFSVLVIASSLFAAAVNVGISMTGQYDNLRFGNPALYQSLQSFFGG